MALLLVNIIITTIYTITTIVQLHLLDPSSHVLEVHHSSPDLKDDLKFDLLSSDQLLGNKQIQVNLRL